MAKGALYWRLKDEKTGKWSYKKVVTTTPEIRKVLQQSGGQPIGWEIQEEE